MAGSRFRLAVSVSSPPGPGVKNAPRMAMVRSRARLMARSRKEDRSWRVPSDSLISMIRSIITSIFCSWGIMARRSLGKRFWSTVGKEAPGLSQVSLGRLQLSPSEIKIAQGNPGPGQLDLRPRLFEIFFTFFQVGQDTAQGSLFV